MWIHILSELQWFITKMEIPKLWELVKAMCIAASQSSYLVDTQHKKWELSVSPGNFMYLPLLSTVQKDLASVHYNIALETA